MAKMASKTAKMPRYILQVGPQRPEGGSRAPKTAPDAPKEAFASLKRTLQGLRQGKHHQTPS
eukprot:8473083-Pyramimonas_sp.AAC.1